MEIEVTLTLDEIVLLSDLVWEKHNDFKDIIYKVTSNEEYHKGSEENELFIESITDKYADLGRRLKDKYYKAQQEYYEKHGIEVIEIE